MLFLVLWVQRQQLVGQTGADVDALPGRTPQPEPPPLPEPVPGPPPPPAPEDT
jgi:hypothetical protein